MVEMLTESDSSSGTRFPVSSDSIERMAAVLAANHYDDTESTAAPTAPAEADTALNAAEVETRLGLGSTATADTVGTDVPRRRRARRAANGTANTSGAKPQRRGGSGVRRTDESRESTTLGDDRVTKTEAVTDADSETPSFTATVEASAAELEADQSRSEAATPTETSEMQPQAPDEGPDDLILTYDEYRALSGSHDKARGTKLASDQESAQVSATYFAQRIEAGAVVTAEVDPETLYNALVLVALNYRDPAQALPRIIKASMDTEQVANYINAACAEAARLRSNANFALVGDLTSISQAMQALTPDEMANANSLVRRVTSRIVHDTDQRTMFDAHLPLELYERIAIALRIDTGVAASRALESTTAQYLMWRWQRTQQAATQRPAETATRAPQPQPVASATRQFGPVPEDRRATLDRETQQARAEMRTLIKQLWTVRQNTDLSSVQARYRPATLRRLALNHLDISDEEWSTTYAQAEEVWAVSRALRNIYGSEKEYDAVDKSVQDQLGVSLDELIAAGLKRTNGLHASGMAVHQVLREYYPRLPQQNRMQQLHSIAGNLRYKIAGFNYGIYVQRQEEARLQPRRLDVQHLPHTFVRLRDSQISRAPERRAAPVAPASRDSRPTQPPVGRPARPTGMSFLRQGDERGQLREPATSAVTRVQHSTSTGEGGSGDDEAWLR